MSNKTNPDEVRKYYEELGRVPLPQKQNFEEVISSEPPSIKEASSRLKQYMAAYYTNEEYYNLDKFIEHYLVFRRFIPPRVQERLDPLLREAYQALERLENDWKPARGFRVVK